VLVVLDDAADERQVRWLLPGSSSCGVVVTSRCRLTGLPGATQIEVGVLDADRALRLLMNMLGPDRVHAEPGAALELVSLCGGLPIALRIAAARLAARPHWGIGQLVERLAVEDRQLDELAHRGLDIRTNLAPSYEILSPAAQRLFRLLGTLETADFPGWIAGPLLDLPAAEAVDVLDELVDARFVDAERPARGGAVRFRLHNLIRAYAREQLVGGESAGCRAEAVERALGAWLYLASEAHRREYGADHPLLRGTAGHWPLDERLVDQELLDPHAWYEHERNGIVAAVRQAADLGLAELCRDLALTAVTLFAARGDNRRITYAEGSGGRGCPRAGFSDRPRRPGASPGRRALPRSG
jgi:hypothetical protein